MDKQTITFCKKDFHWECGCLLLLSIIMFVCLFIFSETLVEFWYAWALMLYVIILYPFYVEIWYYNYDKDTIVEIDKYNQELHYSRRGQSVVIGFDEILTIDKYSSYSKAGTFYYCKILSKNHPPLIITSYLMKGIYKSLKNVRPEIPKDDFGIFFPIPSRHFNPNELTDI